MEIEEKGWLYEKKIISFEIIVLWTEVGKSEKSVIHISIVGKFVLFSVLGSLYFLMKE